MKNKRINGNALEMIMRDVMHGMLGFTHETCRGSETAKMEILAVEEAENSVYPSENIVLFPGARKKDR